MIVLCALSPAFVIELTDIKDYCDEHFLNTEETRRDSSTVAEYETYLNAIIEVNRQKVRSETQSHLFAC